MPLFVDEPGVGQESLQQALGAVVRRQFVVFLSLTLAFIVPISCDQHGMMNLFDLDASSPMQMGHGAQGQSSPCAYGHTTTPGMSMTLSVDAGLTPADLTLRVLEQLSNRPIDTPVYPAQPDSIPPDQPPRLS